MLKERKGCSLRESPREILAYFFLAGSVDAFAVALGERASDRQDLTEGEIILFDVVNVNIRGGYNSTTGKEGIQMVKTKIIVTNKNIFFIGRYNIGLIPRVRLVQSIP